MNENKDKIFVVIATRAEKERRKLHHGSFCLFGINKEQRKALYCDSVIEYAKKIP